MNSHDLATSFNESRTAKLSAGSYVSSMSTNLVNKQKCITYD